MKTAEVIRREMKRAERELAKVHTDSQRGCELYGVQQALAWALGEDVMAPVKCALTAPDEREPLSSTPGGDHA